MPGSPYKKALTLALLTFSLSAFWQAAPAQVYGSDFHTVTVTVATITDIQVSSGSVNLTIDGAGVPAGQDQMTVVDQTTNLLWGVNSSSRKVTVNTNLVAPLFTLNLLALNPTSPGTAAPEVTLSTAPTDLLLNIGRSTGTCVLRYTGVALASQGTGSDSHTITFTVATQ